MSPLSEQDREWVKAIVAEAVVTVLGVAKEHMETRIKEHTTNCPNVKWSRGLLIGLVLGSAFVGSGVGTGVGLLLRVLSTGAP